MLGLPVETVVVALGLPIAVAVMLILWAVKFREVAG